VKLKNLQNPVLQTVDDLMVKIPKGTIEMRDDRIKKKWKVHNESILLSKFPVTQKIYYSIMSECPCTFRGDNRPVETVTWEDAVIFCNTLSELAGLTSCYRIKPNEGVINFEINADGYRLPTEAEWQYACQAGTNNIRYGELGKIAWYKENSNNETHTVGRKEPNEWGLYDMLGNVWEWCSDIYDESVYGKYRIFRGGGWFDVERSVMATTRRRSHPTAFKIDDLGFRIARNL